ncbi:cell division protein FtsA [Heliorestis convoluta]|uniref:Cell division protein FtsA n=1 Tax=Heliorestis convoluta TaxID=356322 RepID=A0A5Q2N2P7_9FIRM|nr:cell division FtsA domain-containing protein [Heliorestis convoluta]QGG47876.1 cell division protein FtsA [Heliorestis convoluta]
MDCCNETIFALDIGTRTVIGLVAKKTEEGLEILHMVIEEHRNRAMLDGQIHDVVQVSQVVDKVKQALEKEVGQSLTTVAVAAAGRTLKTTIGKKKQEWTTLQEFSVEDQLALELAAVQNSLRSIKKHDDDIVKDYHCVGYSVMHYFLEGQAIGSLVGQRGKVAEVEVISTFLPRVVIDSLFSVLARCGLTMKSLTLEPIAAINVVIPANMRQLNLSLVDIGAGTSDIAITAEGTIKAYEMVPIAGDEMTEAICQKYLLDFVEGERIKKDVQAQLLLSKEERERIRFQDILGFEQSYEIEEILATLEPTVSNLAQQIADKILTLNEKSPQAIILIGGGSLTPLLPEKVAEALELPRERVGVRGRESLKGLTGYINTMKGPEYVTPVGIAITSLNHQTLSFIEVTLNGKSVRLLNMRKGTIGDVLLSAGVSMQSIHGRPGMALTVEVNGQVKILRGTVGQGAELSVNGEKAKLNSLVQHGDAIEFIESQTGKNGQGLIEDVVPTLRAVAVILNGRPVKVEPLIFMNGKKVTLQTALVDGAKIQYQSIDTVANLLDCLGQLDSLKEEHSISYTLNGEKKKVLISMPKLTVNGSVASLNGSVKEGDRIELKYATVSEMQIKEIVDLKQWNGQDLRVLINDKEWNFPGEKAKLYVNQKVATGEEWLKEGDQIVILAGKSTELILSELLAKIGFDPTPPVGKKNLQIIVNGFPGDYMTAIRDQSRVMIYWI